jgi:hypothetical protein
MLNMLGAILQLSGKPEEDKKSMSILKSQRRAIFLVIILVMIIDINDFLTNETSFWSGLFTGVVGVTCMIGLIINFRLSKRIGKRLNKKLG